jgi:DNA primase
MQATMKKSTISKKDIDRTRKIKERARAADFVILKRLGFPEVNSLGVQQCCPVHGGDRPDAFCYNVQKHIWSCFSHKCHENNGNDILGLVMSIKEIPFNEALDWIEQILDNEKDLDINSLVEKSERDSVNPLAPNKKIDNSKLKNLKSNYSSIANRSFSTATASVFDAGLCDNGRDSDKRIMIPVKNIEGDIMGFTGRSVFDRCDKCGRYHRSGGCPSLLGLFPKWKNYPKNFKKANELYNIDMAKDYISKTNAAVLVEGPFDVWRLWELGVKNCVASLGISLSNCQIKTLKENECINLITFYDSDSSGHEASRKLEHKLSEDFRIKNMTGMVNCDPGDITTRQFKKTIAPFLERNNAKC